MVDIFVSYDSEDADRITSLVSILEAEGWRVWWDRELVVGPRFDEEIENALNEAQCVVVAWSRNSIRSRWVRDEADHGLNRNVLVPLLIDDVEPPLGFRSAQTANLVGWPGVTGELDRLLTGVRNRINSTRPTDNAAAFKLYQQGVERATGYNKWDMRSAIEMLRGATDLDPGFADAWAYRAEACLNSVVFFESEQLALWDEAENAALTALKLEPGNIVAKTIQGRMLWSAAKNYQTRDALRCLDEVVRIRSDALQAQMWQSLIFMHVGLNEEAKQRLMSVVEVAPKDPLAQFFLSQAWLYQGQAERALEHHARAISLDPTNQVVNLHYPSTWIAAEQLNQAEASIENTRRLGGDDPILTSCQALLWAKRGEDKKARQCCQQTMSEVEAGGMARVHTHHVFHSLAATFALVGSCEEATTQVRMASETGFPNHELFDADPHLRSLHGQPEFDNLMTGLKAGTEDYRSEFFDAQDHHLEP
jgi:tetratricopeptide (TPR) repeat protein